MMIKRPYKNLETTGFLLISLILAALSIAGSPPSPVDIKAGKPQPEWIYIQVRGDISLKGTYLFDHPPDLAEILTGFLKIKPSRDVTFRYNKNQVVSHSLIEIIKKDKVWELSRKEIPAFQKITLGIPISINRETEDDLTAIPGIGPQTAKILIRERQNRGGFKSLDELKSLPGIGKGIFRKIEPFLTL